MATYIAVEMLGSRLGDKEAGWRQLEKVYTLDPVKRSEILSRLKLYEWKAGEVEQRNGNESPTELSNARYLYSAKAIRTAVKDQENDFVKRWHNEIAKTRWNRTTSQTVIDAYHKLTGKDLRKIIESPVESDN